MTLKDQIKVKLRSLLKAANMTIIETEVEQTASAIVSTAPAGATIDDLDLSAIIIEEDDKDE